MAHKVRKDGLIVDASDNRLVAELIDSFVVSVGEGAQADWVIFRLHHKDWEKNGPLVPQNQLHQFAIPSKEANQLGRRLLEYAAQAEKDAKGHQAH